MTQAHTRHRLFVVVDKHITAWRVEEVLLDQGYHAMLDLEPIQPLHPELFESPDPVHSDVMLLMSDGIEKVDQVPGDCPHCKVLVLSGRTENLMPLEPNTVHGNLPSQASEPLRYSELLRRIQEVA
jgi:hypothetical protein